MHPPLGTGLNTSTIATGCEHRYYLWCEHLKFCHSHIVNKYGQYIELEHSVGWTGVVMTLRRPITLSHSGTHTHTHTHTLHTITHSE